MFRGRVSWNLRDRHMAETLDQLVAHLNRQGKPAKVVVWEHNSHLGDARATPMGDRRSTRDVSLRFLGVNRALQYTSICSGFHLGGIQRFWERDKEDRDVLPSTKNCCTTNFLIKNCAAYGSRLGFCYES